MTTFNKEANTAATERTDSGDFRSIIDDLTVENQELKERLRAFEAAQAPPPEVQQDRLFEVKVHGLPAHQKQKLVETLQAFAQRVEVLNQQSSQQARSAAPYVSVNRSVQPHGQPTITSADRIESSYASASASGQLSRTTPDSNQPSTSKTPRRVTAQPIEGTPAGLLYKGYDSSMTEREKKVMVVKRLEHLFSGKGSRQSKLKNAGQSPNATTGFDLITERMREAQILPSIEDSPEDGTVQDGRGTLDDDNATQPADDNETVDYQRETRLIDLDPDRAQLPQEYIRYIRHLQPSKKTEEDTTETSAISEWVSIYLLMNLAQLHMLNVTPDFVRSAITEVSTRFELSTDRQKVRWHGGPGDSKSGSDSDRAMPDTTDSSDSERRKQGHSISTGTTEPYHHGISNTASISNQAASAHERRRHDLEYKPLFVKPRRPWAHQPYQDDSASAYLPRSTVDGDAYGSALGTMMTGATNTSIPRSDAGPIVFFSGALFVTDLSGDSAEVLAQQHRSRNSHHGYKRAPIAPLGTDRPKRYRPSRPTRSESYSRTPMRPFKDYSKVAEALQQDNRLKTPDRVGSDDANSNDINFDPKWTDDGKSASPQQRIVMEASGIGGTKPDDNFVVIVETAHPKMRSEFHKQLQADVASTLDPSRKTAKLLHMIEEAKLDPSNAARKRKGKQPASQSRHEKVQSAPVKITVLSRRELKLQPSETPPPAQFWGDDDCSDDDDNMSVDSSSTDQGIKELKESPPNMNSVPEEEDEEQGDGFEIPDDDDSDGSIDMMGFDREKNPHLVAERELEYVRNLRLTAIGDSDRPSGSGRATAGDDDEEDETSDVEEDNEEGDDSGDDDDDASMGA